MSKQNPKDQKQMTFFKYKKKYLILNHIIYILINLIILLKFLYKIITILDGDWGLGIGDWGLGIGPNPQSPIPNPQSPIPI